AATATSAVSAVMTAINGAVSFHLQSEIEEIENSRQKIAETQQVRVQLNVASSIKINSEARIKSLLLEIPSLEINARLAAIDSIRAIARLRENVQAVMDMQAEMDRMLIHLLDDPRTDPSFRLVRNEALAQFQTAWDAA